MADQLSDHSRVDANSEKEQIDEEVGKNSLDNEEPTEEHASPPLSGKHETVFILVICLAQFLSLAGLAQSIAPLHIIGDSFGVNNAGQLGWYPAAFSLTLGTFILPAGRLGDMFGHRNLYMIGFAWYAVWSVVAGVSIYSGDILFCVARAFQGIGAALLVPNALAIVGRTYGASPKKNMVFALFGAAAPTGWVVGAVMSSILAQLAWWPWAYFAMAIACVFMIPAAWAIIPADELDKNERGQFDMLGLKVPF